MKGESSDAAVHIGMANVIGDIAGNYKTLMALIAKMPDEEVISVGDMVDRGPRSKEVLDWFMSNGRAILGNHEHLMLNACRRTGFYGDDVWFWNGGTKTFKCFDGIIPEKYLTWIESLPLYIEEDGCLITHAFWDEALSFEDACNMGDDWTQTDFNIIWNRGVPVRREKYRLQVAGHNSQMGLRWFSDEAGKFALCLDTSRDKVLTGMHLPTGQIYQQDYID